MNKTEHAFLKTVLIWLLLGVLAGWLTAVYLTIHEFNMTADLTGSIVQNRSLPKGLKQTSKEYRIKGESYLRKYGYHSFQNIKVNFLFTSIFCIIIFEGIGMLLFFKKRRETQKLENRIHELTEYLCAINQGDAKALVRTEDCFSHLEDEIYKTVIELRCTKEAAVQNHQVLSERIADIAHQLKTPLTSMTLMTELLEDCQAKEGEAYLIRLRNQTERLKKLVSGLLLLAKLDAHVITFDKVRLDVEELFHRAAEPLEEIVKQKEISLEHQHTAPETPAFILADPQWTVEAIMNIFKNCVEHTPRQGKIIMTCQKNPLSTEIIIEDSGPGFLKEDLPHLFERFYRGKHAAKDSAGIGLALVKLIVEKQNGHICAENTSDGHARFRLRFYI